MPRGARKSLVESEHPAGSARQDMFGRPWAEEFTGTSDVWEIWRVKTITRAHAHTHTEIYIYMTSKICKHPGFSQDFPILETNLPVI